jgi:hypothetical protein
VKSQTHLVCQHLENISREALEKHQAIIKRFVRKRQGVYALYRRGKLYYVGLAGNLRSRLASHLKDRHGRSWDRFSVYLTIGDHHLRELESLILRIVRPKGNKQVGRFPRSEDIRRRFAREIRLKQRVELGELLGRASQFVSPDDDADGGRQPSLARYVSGPIRLRARHKGKQLRASVRRDGRVRFAGKLYNSPSLAGAKAVKRRTCNGWTFWLYERAPGDWVPLKHLRTS